MKKFFMLTLAVILIFSNAIIAEAEDVNPLIKQGDYGSEVIELHQKLIELGLFKLRAESPWGPASMESLKIVQGSLDLSTTGIVETADDLEMLLQLNVEETKRVLFIPIKKGSTGEKVEQLQAKLTELGFPTSGIDGRFGDKTLAGLLGFQKAMGMEENGTVRTKAEYEYILSLSIDDIPASERSDE